MSITPRSLSLGLVLAGAPTGALAGDDVSLISSPIIAGELATDDAAVVALTDRNGLDYCTGTLISPRIIATAAHCLHQVPPPALVFFGADPGRDGMFVEVAGAEVHPGYGQSGLRDDLGIVILARPIPITPVPLQVTPLGAADLGRSTRFVGFGTTGPTWDSPSGVKRTGAVPLDGVDEDWLAYGVVGCHGDSGGPAFLTDADGVEHLAGITSHGDSSCQEGGFSTRVDLRATWLQDRIAALDPPLCRLDTRCDPACAAPDPDCAAPVLAPDHAAGGCAVTVPRAGRGAWRGAGALIVLAFLSALTRKQNRREGSHA